MNNTNHNVIGIWVLVALVLVSTVVLMEPDTLLLFILSAILGYIYYFVGVIINSQTTQKTFAVIKKHSIKATRWVTINIIRTLSFVLLAPTICLFLFIIGFVCLVFYLLGQVFIRN